MFILDDLWRCLLELIVSELSYFWWKFLKLNIKMLKDYLGLLSVFLIVSRKFGTEALKDITVTIPQAVKIMDTVTLSCDYDLEGEPLYTVKWYKAGKEFYRYIPKELPNTRVFPLPGIDVDLSRSSPKKVVLRNVQPEVSGKYKCEVSTDSPNFYTFDKSGYMYVVDVPFEDPKLTVDKDLFEISYTLKGNCSSPPSFPAANITWLLNKKKVEDIFVINRRMPSYSLTNQNPRRIPLITLSLIELELSFSTFQNGKAVLSCQANIFSLYQKEVQIVLEEERPKARPSSILGTRDIKSGSSTNKFLFIPFLLFFIVLR